jgi:hypothetical protein
VRIGWRRSPGVVREDVRPELRLRLGSNPEQLVVPDVIAFRTTRLRIGAHPPFMDSHVGHAEFTRLPFLDIRGEDEAVRDLSRHVACLWRDVASSGYYVQLGWPGPGELIRPRAHARVLRQGRPQDAVRLTHRDVLHLSPAVEYIFLEVGQLRNRVTPERNKMAVLDV